MPTPLEAVQTYILAKDGNRPFLMRHAFAEDAELEMVVKTDAISFPGAASGLRAIEDVLVRRFGVDYENVYTVCPARPPAGHLPHFACHWLVGMSAKSDGQVRVGCGRYDWHFAPDDTGLVKKLVIAIEAMNTLPAAELEAAMTWLSGLSYPWCTPDEVLGGMPKAKDLAAIENYVRQAHLIPPER